MATASTEPRAIGRPRALTREQVVEASLEMARGGGFSAVSMRKLAVVLGVSPATLYAYFEGKDELIAAMVDQAFSSVAVRDAAPQADWRDELAGLLRAYHCVLVEYPGLYDPALVLRAASPVGDAFAERCLVLLEHGGLTPDQALERITVLASFVVGLAATRRWSEVALQADVSPELHDSDRTPHVVAATTLVAAATSEVALTMLDAAFESGLDLLLPPSSRRR